jgi:polyferredoxin
MSAIAASGSRLAARLLHWRHVRTAAQGLLLLVAALMIADGLLGPQLAPKNLATVLTWIHYRGLAVLALLLAGNLFCFACPFMLARAVARRWLRPTRSWPRRLRNKWLSAGLFVAVLFAYELLDLWASPLWTAWLIVAYFVGAVVVDSLFRGAPFCKYVCPLGQFNFLAATVSPLEIRTRATEACGACRTKDCIKGRTAQRGCELGLYQPLKTGNLDCTFCLDCLHACPYDNVEVGARLPGSELWLDPQRSGIGRLSRRTDLAALAVVFTFGAIVNAFGMVTPVYALEEWLAGVLHTRSEILVLGVIFLAGLGLLPLLLCGGAAWASERLRGPGQRRPLAAAVTRQAYALLPLGLGLWAAHYSFHFVTGAATIGPVAQSFVADVLGRPLLGAARWGMGSLLPQGWLAPLEIGLLGLGWLGSLLVAYRVAGRDTPERAVPAFIPWAVILTMLLALAAWLMSQPMEMRGVLLGG